MTSFTISETGSTTFTRSHAKHIAARIAADLARMTAFYPTGLTEQEIMDYQNEAIEYLCAQAESMIKLSGNYRRLRTAPGIGIVLGLTIMLETGPIERFKSAGCYASYCRAVNSSRTSNDKKKGSNNKKNGNKYLAWAFVEAAHHAQQSYPRIQRWFDKKKAATNRTVAVKALGCKLSKAVYYILRDDTEFDMQKMFG